MTTYDDGYRAGIEAAARVCRERANHWEFLHRDTGDELEGRFAQEAIACESAILALRPEQPAGMVLVPEVPTNAMCRAYCRAVETDTTKTFQESAIYRWSLMLAAAKEGK